MYLMYQLFLCGPMMGCARNLTNIFRLCTFYDFEEKVIKLLRYQI